MQTEAENKVETATTTSAAAETSTSAAKRPGAFGRIARSVVSS